MWFTMYEFVREMTVNLYGEFSKDFSQKQYCSDGESERDRGRIDWRPCSDGESERDRDRIDLRS